MGEKVIRFDMTNSISEEGLFDWICFKIADRNLEVAKVIRSYHANEIQNLVDYIFDLYQDHFVSSFNMTSILLDAMKACKYSKELLTSTEVVNTKVSSTVKM